MYPEKPEQPEEKRTASDMEVAKFLIGHIENPCEVDIGQGIIKNIRDFYIYEAKRILPTFTDPDATNQLNEHIEKFNPKEKL